MPHQQLVKLLVHLAEMLIPLFGHRFSHIGSLYFGEGTLDSEVRTPHPHALSIPNGFGARAVQAGKEKLSPLSTEQLPEEDEHDHEHAQTPTLASVECSRLNSIGTVDFAFGSSLPTPTRTPSTSSLGLLTPRPRKTPPQFSSLSLTPASLSRSSSTDGRHAQGLLAVHSSHFHSALSRLALVEEETKFHVGPIISWPFFGSHRGELSHATPIPEIDRGPWRSTAAYLKACVEREAQGVARENEGRAKPHRLHLDPDEVVPRGRSKGKRGEYVWGYGFVKRARLAGYGEGDDLDDLGEVEEEHGENVSGSETPSDDRDSDSDSDGGSPTPSINSDSDEDMMYRDYRRFQRSTFLVAELSRRERCVRSEMGRWKKCVEGMEKVLREVIERVQGREGWHKEGVGGPADEGEMFGLDCHDLSLDNVFVDVHDPSKIVRIQFVLKSVCS